ncbi:MAG: hypothetical protein H0V14_00115 [Chitinophagaceae bacterium]|nr:hypothetical protein [Chitinophagaceae bacterium]
MKNLLPLLLAFFLVKCASRKESEPINIVGVYSLMKQTLKNGKDSLVEKKQLKIYTDKYMMYASPNPTDSLANYGIATYKIDDGKVVENIFYTSGYGDRKDSAILKVEKTVDGYKQVIEDVVIENKKYTSTEEYDSVGKATNTPLDGVWKQTTRMHVDTKGDTLVDEVQVQFKIYKDGYFIWANTYEDSVLKKYPSAFGYGTFEMDGNNKATEINLNSTYAVSLISKPYEIDIEFPDKDSYKQTHLNTDGGKSIEVYQRLK